MSVVVTIKEAAAKAIKDIYGVLGIKNKGAAIGMYLRGQVA